MNFRNILFLVLLAFGNQNCTNASSSKSNSLKPKSIVDETRIQDTIGYLFIDIGYIYHNEGGVSITDMDSDTITQIKNTHILIGGKIFDLIEEEHLYEDEINVTSFDPEYGLFILECYGKKNGFYEVLFNDQSALIDASYKNIEFKDLNKYVIESYPIPTNENPLRKEPDENSTIIPYFSKHLYVSLEIKGDWLKVRDDRECYLGAEPSRQDIIGWVKWRKNGKIIIKLAQLC